MAERVVGAAYKVRDADRAVVIDVAVFIHGRRLGRSCCRRGDRCRGGSCGSGGGGS